MALFGLFGGKPSQDEFAALVAKRLQANGRKFRYDKTTFNLASEDGATLNLGNAYRYYCEAPKERREQVLAEFLATWAETSSKVPKDWAEASSHVMPYVRPLEYLSFSMLTLQMQGQPFKLPPQRPLGEELGVYLAFDWPSSIATVDSTQLAEWGVSFEQAMAQAEENLRRMSGDSFKVDSPGLYVSPWRGPYDSSRLVLHDLFRRLRVAGAPVVMVPNRDVLLVTGADDRKGLQRMGEIAAEVLRQPRPLSGEALVLGEGGWSSFRLQHEVPEHRGLIEIGYGMRAGSYEEQKRLLNALHEKTSQDIFVASYVVTKNTATGLLTSYATWSEGVDTLLPKADLVAFFRPATKDTFMVPWAAAREVVGHRMQATELHPLRYAVPQSPDEAEFARLKQKAL